tara:strand:- start:393 stop:683 length:291 start_codon:yes stop_codon:yes gene_type:complete
MANTITNEMCLAAAFELAKIAEEKGLNDNYIIPTMDDWEIFVREAVAVGEKAIEQGITKIKPTRNELRENASNLITRARNQVKTLTKAGLIKPFQE